MQCDPSLLWTLVQQEEEPNESTESLARHLESCVACRRELEQIGGEVDQWDEARQWLGDIEDAINPDCPVESPPTVDLSFLDAPTHPEMLGRIGRYDVEGVLGCGGMGVVLRAHDSDLHRTVAIKVLAPHWATSPTARQRFAREARAAASVAHENVIPIYNVEADGKLPFLVMRYVPGLTLEKWVDVHHPPDVPSVLRVAGQLAEGLAAAHRRGLVHRDIKPGNVLVGDNIDRVWITDFGLARAVDSIAVTRAGVIAGTPHYMSPEQAKGKALDHRSDWFSLGGLLYFLCTGRPPFDADNTLAVLHQVVAEKPRPLTSIRDDLPPSLVSLIERLLHRDPDKRLADCQAVAKQLDQARHEFSQHLTAKSPQAWVHRWGRIVVGTTCLVLMIVAVGLGWGRPTDPPPAAGAKDPVKRNASADKLDLAFEEERLMPGPSKPHNHSVSGNVHQTRVERAFALERSNYRKHLDRLNGEINRSLQKWEPAFHHAINVDDDGWSREVKELNQMIEETESFSKSKWMRWRLVPSQQNELMNEMQNLLQEQLK